MDSSVNRYRHKLGGEPPHGNAAPYSMAPANEVPTGGYPDLSRSAAFAPHAFVPDQDWQDIVDAKDGGLAPSAARLPPPWSKSRIGMQRLAASGPHPRVVPLAAADMLRAKEAAIAQLRQDLERREQAAANRPRRAPPPNQHTAPEPVPVRTPAADQQRYFAPAREYEFVASRGERAADEAAARVAEGSSAAPPVPGAAEHHGEYASASAPHPGADASWAATDGPRRDMERAPSEDAQNHATEPGTQPRWARMAEVLEAEARELRTQMRQMDSAVKDANATAQEAESRRAAAEAIAYSLRQSDEAHQAEIAAWQREARVLQHTLKEREERIEVLEINAQAGDVAQAKAESMERYIKDLPTIEEYEVKCAQADDLQRECGMLLRPLEVSCGCAVGSTGHPMHQLIRAARQPLFVCHRSSRHAPRNKQRRGGGVAIDPPCRHKARGQNPATAC